MEKTYIIAEIGINYNGELENIFRLIDAAASAGADAAKFQFFKARYLYPKTAGELDWRDARKRYRYTIYDAAERLELPEAWIGRIIARCARKKVDFLASVFDEKGLKFLTGKGMRKIKLASYTVTNIPLVEAAAKTGYPIYLSTGGSTIGEVEEAVNAVFCCHDKLTLLHCSIKYPTELKECNMGIIETLRHAFPYLKVGYSDHTAEATAAAVQAIYLGASVIEKHITLDRRMAGPDHFFSIEPRELNNLVAAVRSAELKRARGDFRIDKTIYGSSARIVYPHERYLRDFAFMRLYAGRPIKRGDIIRPADIAILRPGKKPHGLEPRYLRLFKERRVRAVRAIRAEDPIQWDSFLA